MNLNSHFVYQPVISFYLASMNTRLPAGVLSYVLAISLLVSTGISMLILYVYYSRTEYISYEKRIRLIRNLESAMTLTLGEYDHFEYDKDYLYDLYGEGLDSISIRRTRWGLMDLFVIRAFNGPLSESKAYTIGHIPSAKGKSALYLVDDGRPLSVVGDTRLIGDSYLPLAGIQSAYINRIGYTNEELLEGEELRSDPELPEVGLDDHFDALDDLSPEEAEMTSDTLSHSFLFNPVQLSGSTLRLNGVYKGNVFIQGSSRVVFDSLSRTSDVVVFAPVIELRTGFEGNGQFFATDTLIVQKEVKLSYPTVLAAYNERNLALIQVDTSATVSGWILLDGKEEGFRQRVLYLNEKSEVKGMIYCNGMLEIYGQVTGHSTVKRFLVNAPTAIYENYLFNATLDATQRDTAMLALSEWFFTPETHILKYLY